MKIMSPAGDLRHAFSPPYQVRKTFWNQRRLRKYRAEMRIHAMVETVSKAALTRSGGPENSIAVVVLLWKFETG